MTGIYNAAKILFNGYCIDNTVSLQALCFLTTACRYSSGSSHNASSILSSVKDILLVVGFIEFSWGQGYP